jgi:hypothetical protein
MGIFEANLALFRSLVQHSLKFKFLPFCRQLEEEEKKVKIPASI